MHASLLPRWRGAAPIQRAIVAGDAETGVTIMQMDAGLDTGPVYAATPARHPADDDAGSLHDRLAALGADLLLRGPGSNRRVARRARCRSRKAPPARPTRTRSTRPRRGSAGTGPRSSSSARCAPSIRRRADAHLAAEALQDLALASHRSQRRARQLARIPGGAARRVRRAGSGTGGIAARGRPAHEFGRFLRGRRIASDARFQ